MMKRQNIRTLFLIIGTFTYLLCGASFFDYAESKHEMMQRTALNRIENIIMKKYNISQNDFRILTTVVIKNVPHKAGVQWKFSGAFYFATTVLTTIGYGHSTPATYLGKSFCMLYALMGIPLGLIMFQSIGERLNTFVAFSLRFCKRCLRFRKADVKETNSIPLSDKSLIISVSIISTLMMTIGAAVFSAWENWTYFDAFYYCFITLTTIGFGDYVALQKNSALQDKPEYVIFSLVFILFGLSVVSAAINLLVLRFLTMNTEDERRDEAEAALQSASGVRLEGDVITANGSIISGIIPMENYLHNTSHVYPFNSNYHFYNYQKSAKNKKNFCKNKFRRTNQSYRDDLFSDHEYLDVDESDTIRRQQITYNDNQEQKEMSVSDIIEIADQRKKTYIPKQIIVSDSGSEKKFDAHLKHLRAHAEYSEMSEYSLTPEHAIHRNSNVGKKTSKVFCKKTNNILGKQQRKNYKHMISDDSESEINSELCESIKLQNTNDFCEDKNDQTSVCSCTCYGNNQSISGWRTNKSKKQKNKTSQVNSETKNLNQVFILNRKATKRYKNSGRSMRLSSNVKYKNMKSSIRRMTKEDQQFNTDQSKKLSKINQKKFDNSETILRPIYFQHTPHPTTNQIPIMDNLINGSSNRAIFLNNCSISPQQILNTENNTLIFNKQLPIMFMESNKMDQPNFNQFDVDYLKNEILRNQSIENLNVTNNSSNLSNSDQYQINLNTINSKKLSSYIDNKDIYLMNQSGEKKQIVKLNEKQFKNKFTQHKIEQNNNENLSTSCNGSSIAKYKQMSQLSNLNLVENKNKVKNKKSNFLMKDQELKLSIQRASI